jgi:hypothetical protein
MAPEHLPFLSFSSSKMVGSEISHVEASLAKISQSGLKTEGGATTGGARGTITEITLEAS